MEENQEKHSKKRLIDGSDLEPFLVKLDKHNSIQKDIYISKDGVSY